MKKSLILLAMFAVAVTACKKKEEAPVAAPAPAVEVHEPAATAAPQVGITVSAVRLGNTIGADKKVASEASSFGKKDTIYASVETQGTGSAKLKAKWTFHKGDKVAVVNETEQTLEATAPAATEFHVSKPDGWPSGNYQVEIELNGASSASKSFTVQ